MTKYPGRCVRIFDDKNQALGSIRQSGPRQRRRDVGSVYCAAISLPGEITGPTSITGMTVSSNLPICDTTNK